MWIVAMTSQSDFYVYNSLYTVRLLKILNH